ncbi:MAG: GIY-YIG nuclease family protein [Planctomycetota bacterium]|nr:GIY-YIG nuclease family protein [Planctomycetota bacterium]
MKTVYLPESTSHPHRHYTGITSDLRKRIRDHNSGQSPHTSKWRPWKIVLALTFADEAQAYAFERYLKSGPGRAFAGRHFW